MHDGQNGGRPAVLVVYSDPIVLRDLVEIVTEYDRNCRILVASSEKDAIDIIRLEEDVRISLIELAFHPRNENPLVEAVTTRGGLVIGISDFAKEAVPVQVSEIIERPFTEEQIKSALRRATKHTRS